MKRFWSAALLVSVACLAAGSGQELKQQDVFIAGQDGYHTYRIPSLLVTAKGTLLAFCEGRKNSASDSGDIDLLIKRSTDGGRTWSPQQVVWNDGPNTCGNPCPVVDETTGVIWLLMTHNPGEMNEGQVRKKEGPRTRTVWVSRSEDDGRAWAPPVEVTAATKDPAWGWYATGPGVGIQIRYGSHKGRLVIPCDHSYSDPATGAVELGSHVIYSDDHGRTWKRGGNARPQMNECQVVELADGQGTLLLNMRHGTKGTLRSHSLSRDGGETWTAPELQPQLVEPRCQASLLRFGWPEGKEPGRILFSNPAALRRTNLVVRVSYDDGKSWPVGKTLNPKASAYSCLAVLQGKTLGCLYERGESNPYEKITLARFPLEWLEAKE